jgi:hypothetical protein
LRARIGWWLACSVAGPKGVALQARVFWRVSGLPELREDQSYVADASLLAGGREYKKYSVSSSPGERRVSGSIPLEFDEFAALRLYISPITPSLRVASIRQDVARPEGFLVDDHHDEGLLWIKYSSESPHLRVENAYPPGRPISGAERSAVGRR